MTCSIEAMKPSTLLRSLSSKIQSRLSPPPVAPWPPVRSAFDQWLSAELDELRLQPHQPADCCMSGAWHSKSLDVAVATQRMAAKFIATAGACLSDVERKMVDDYLDDTVELLDACNGLRERLETIRGYTDSLAVALHCIEGDYNVSTAAMRRAMIALESCEAMEKNCAELERCVSNLRKLGKKLTKGAARSDAFGENCTMAVEFHEALTGSRAVALLVLGVLGIAISVKSRRGLPVIRACKTVHWASSLHELYREVKEEFDKRRKGGIVGLHELRRTASAAQSLRDLISRRAGSEELKVAAENLKRRCGELEGRVKLFGESFHELYRQLILIRMPLLQLGVKGKSLELVK